MSAEPPRDVVHFQPAVLDAYEKLFASCRWNESRLNEALESMMASMLPLLRAQRACGEQLFGCRCGNRPKATIWVNAWRSGCTCPHW
ncbi:MAG TPA: hypothetical protein VNV39_10305 [Stellaceae bacterium]|nr:hypothetical protein [Stellaceae bacterium]